MANMNFTETYSYHNLELIERASTLKNNRFYTQASIVLKNREPSNRNGYNKLADLLITRFPDHIIQQSYDKTNFYKDGESVFSLGYEANYFHFYCYADSKERMKSILDIVSEYTESYFGNGVIHANWVIINSRQELANMSLDIPQDSDLIPELYPFIPDIPKFFSDYAASKENILILIGDPGLGKTAFIRQLLKHNKWNCTLTYDEYVMGKDQFYLDFIRSQDRALVLEDADMLLQNRLEGGNKVMSKLLNASDGLVSVNKKFIFTANVDNIRDIDPALIRRGRCFDVLHFNALTLEQAQKVAEKIGKPVPTKKQNTYTIAELFNGEEIAGTKFISTGFNKN